MSNKFRKVLAAILAGTMVLGSGVVANASEESADGNGTLDVVEAEDIFNVILPTTAEVGDQLDYILDPTGVIAKTNFEKYGGTASASFEQGKTMYFRQEPASGSNVATYSDVSAPIKAYNKSTMDVEIQVQAKVATPSGIIIATSSVAGQKTGKATPSIYLAVKDATSSTAVTTTQRVVATSSIANAKANYKVVYASDSNTYKTQLATGSNAKTEAELDAAFQSYSFSLTGDCNPNGKWVGLTEVPPTVTLVWTIEKPDGATEVGNGPKMTVSSTGLITITGLTSDQNYEGLLIKNNEGGPYPVNNGACTWNEDNYSAENGGSLTCQLGADWLATLRGITGEATLNLTDGTSIKAPIKIS